MDKEWAGVMKDAPKLCSYISEEVWTLVIDQVESPQDLENLSNSSLFFRNLLLGKRTLFLFQNVWKDLAHFLAIDYSPTQNTAASANTNNGQGRGAMAPLIQIFLSNRLVCKNWNQAIENFFAGLPPQSHQNMRNLETYPCVNGWTHNRFDDSLQTGITKFLNHFEATHYGPGKSKSPFLGRSVDLSCRYSRVARDFDTFTILRKYGDHILYCTLRTDDNFRSTQGYYRKLKESLELMPNLIGLEIVDVPEFLQTAANIAAKINAGGDIPKLQNLKYLKTKHLPMAILNKFLQTHEQLEILEVPRVIASVPLPNLRKWFLMISSDEDFRLLEISQHGCPLETIHLNFTEYPAIIPMPRIYALLESKWGATLTHVMITFPKVDGESGIQTISKFPMLKRVMIVLWEEFNLDFLLAARNSLEFLHVCVFMDCDPALWKDKTAELANKQGNAIKFLDCFVKHEPKIWQHFPKLKRYNFEMMMKKDMESMESGNSPLTRLICRCARQTKPIKK